MPLNCKISFILLFLALTAYGQMQERVAIIQTMDNNDSLGINDLAYLTDKLRETAVNVLPKEQYGVMTTESIVAFLGSQERAAKICNESSCLAELGRKVSADYVAQGRIGRFGKDLTIKVELYSVKTGNLIGSFTGDSKDIYGLRDIITEKATDLFKKMPNTSNVKKTVPPPVAPTPPPPAPVASPAPKDIPPEAPIAPIAKKNDEEEYDYTYHIQRLIDEGFEKNKDFIREKSFHISPVDRELLYEKNKRRNALGLAVLNVLPGFGLGSYIQGDIVFSVTQSVLDVTAIVIMMVFGSETTCLGNVDPGDDNKCTKKEIRNESIGMISPFIFGASRLTGLIRSFVYQSKYNAALMNTLYVDENFSLSIDPLIIPKDGTPAVGLAFNVRY